MILKTIALSTFNSQPLSSNITGVSFKQFKRYYPGDYFINFVKALSGSNDFKVKNFTNFYLTDNQKFSNIFDTSSEPLRVIMFSDL